MLRTAPDIPGLPHKWAKEIAAWAFGRLVQWRYVSPEATNADWRDCPYASRGMPNWIASDIEFRAPTGHPRMSTDTDTASVTDDDIRQLRHAALCAGLDFEFSALLEQRDALARRVADLEANGIHSCHPACDRPMCVLVRERDALLATLALQKESYEREIRIEVEAERARCIGIVEQYQVPVGNSAAGEMASAWTIEALREVRDAIRTTPKEPT